MSEARGESKPADPSETTAREHAERVSADGAYLKSSTHLDAPELKVAGTAGPEKKAEVNLGIEDARTVKEAGLSIGFTPEVARELADELHRQADFAERYAEHRREQESEHGD